ncbi:MAG: hypothetical protein DRN04_05540 [Thermoprotei archaeon]|nr:MAG: hypothetical protein DRN04_05540 [Thermoprotei archaeon]
MKPNKAVIIGFDAPIAKRVYEFALKGELPTIKKLIEEGVYAENCLVPLPTITPPNWTTIVTGAWIGTHQVSCFNIWFPGWPLNKTVPAFTSKFCRAEYIWNALERAGLRAIVINWPSTWPPTAKNMVQVAGTGLTVNEWRIDLPEGTHVAVALADAQVFCTEDLPLANKIVLKEASGWANLPEAKKLLEAELKLEYRRAKFKVREKTWYMLVVDEGEGFSKVALCEEKDYSKAFAVLRPGEWSKTIYQKFDTERGVKEAAFRVKLLELSPDASKVRLLVTPLCCTDPKEIPVYPEDIKLPYDVGLPATHGVFDALNLGLIDIDTWIECIDMEHKFFAEIAVMLMKKYSDWALLCMHFHCPDWAYHAFINKIDPATASPEELKDYQRAELEFYKSLDRAVARILEQTDENTLVVIVSDHGAKATTAKYSVAEILEKAGLLAYKIDEEGNRVIDWSRTKAVPQRSCYIFINLKGRDPHGIVDPKDYDKVRDEVIKALYEYTDPATGRKPIVFALKKEDARIIGLYGDTIGDIVYAVSPYFGGQHGPHLPTAEYSIGSLKGLLIMKGPGIKKGYVLKRTVWLTDIVPTICYLMELPIPRDCEGAIIYQALEDPDIKIKELKELRKKCEKLKEALEKTMYLTHTYEMP